jgi:hypothetical protein
VPTSTTRRFRRSIAQLFKTSKRRPTPCPKQRTALSSQSPRRGWDFPCRNVKESFNKEFFHDERC